MVPWCAANRVQVPIEDTRGQAVPENMNSRLRPPGLLDTKLVACNDVGEIE